MYMVLQIFEVMAIVLVGKKIIPAFRLQLIVDINIGEEGHSE